MTSKVFLQKRYCQKRIFNIAASKDTTDLVCIQDLVVSSYEMIEKRFNNIYTQTMIPNWLNVEVEEDTASPEEIAELERVMK